MPGVLTKWMMVDSSCRLSLFLGRANSMCGKRQEQRAGLERLADQDGRTEHAAEDLTSRRHCNSDYDYDYD